MKYRKGFTNTEEHNRIISEAQKKRWANASLIICPHCNKSSKSVSNMNRWHFDNCKLKNR